MFNTALLPLLAALALAAMTATSSAQESRYTMEKTENGIVRMDTATGEMSLCHERDGRMDCAMAGDQRSALQDRIDRLERRLSTLEKEIADLKANRPDALPSDKDLDRAMGVIEDFMRRFFNMVDNLNKDFKDRTGQPEPAPGPQDT
jgi:hypothetical protein